MYKYKLLFFTVALTLSSTSAYPQQGAQQGAEGTKTQEAQCNGAPCKVVFTLDKDNNLILEKVEKHHKNEAVIRLTTKEAQTAAKGPATTNPSTPPKVSDDFSHTLEQLAKIPGLGFLTASHNTSKNAEHGTKANNNTGKNAQNSKKVRTACHQAKAFMAALSKDKTSTTEEHLTTEEFKKICGVR